MVDDPLAHPDLFGHTEDTRSNLLARKFGATPFDVFDGRTEEWKARKRQWISIGVESHLGREAQDGWNTRAHSNGLGEWLSKVDNDGARTDFAHGWRTGHDVSVFDPVLAESIIQLWSVPGDVVADPFAGGSVRGIVSAVLGRKYIGIDLRPEQVAENIQQAKRVDVDGCEWREGDAFIEKAPAHDLLFTCPPYGSLEKYSDDRRCFANMDYTNFIVRLSVVITNWAKALKPGGFAVVVANNFREKQKGRYTNLRPMCAELTMLVSKHLEFWEDCAFLTPLGTVPVRASHNFATGHKLGRCWQRVLVWRKSPDCSGQEEP